MTNKFSKWLSGSGYTQEEFADRLTSMLNEETVIRQANVSGWARGLYKPKTELRLLIKRATSGMVGVGDWS